MARVVAELGRPETPEETAARKAESSRIYRSSQTFRNLIAAILATLAVVAVVIFGVPRGSVPERAAIDPVAEAAATSEALGRPILSAALPDSWRVNAASVEGGSVQAWTVVYAPSGDRGFLRVAQGLDAGETWAAETLGGAAVTGSVEIGDVTWDEYRITNPGNAGNVSYALAAPAGADTLLIYGSVPDDLARQVAAAFAPGVLDLEEGS
jgi:hypothetical protein